MTDAWQVCHTDTLLAIRENLLKGIDSVAEHLDNGTIDTQTKEGAATPREAGALTLMLLVKINEILLSRGLEQKW